MWKQFCYRDVILCLKALRFIWKQKTQQPYFIFYYQLLTVLGPPPALLKTEFGTTCFAEGFVSHYSLIRDQYVQSGFCLAGCSFSTPRRNASHGERYTFYEVQEGDDKRGSVLGEPQEPCLEG